MRDDRRRNTNTKYKVLLREFGYSFEQRTLINLGVKNKIPASIVGKFSDISCAVEHLIPIINSKEFLDRVLKIQNVGEASNENPQD